MTIAPFEDRREQYIVSSSSALLELDVINAAFGSKDLPWCRPLPEEALRASLESSYCLGVYELVESSKNQIGFARLITDHVTLAYLTDVFVLPSHQGRGLGNWLISCVGEVLKSMPDLRKAMLVANGNTGEEYYSRMLGMERIEQGFRNRVMMNSVGPGLEGRTTEDAQNVWSGQAPIPDKH